MPPATVLTREQALKIRKLYTENQINMVKLAARFGVSQQVVSLVCMGKHCTVRDLPNISRSNPQAS